MGLVKGGLLFLNKLKQVKSKYIIFYKELYKIF